MNKEDLEQQIKCIEIALKSHENGVKVSKEKLVELKEQLENYGKRWKPKNGETYWCLTAGGLYEHIFGSGDKCDELYYNIGNCFKTYDEAKKSMDRRLAEQDILNMCDSTDTDIITKSYWYINIKVTASDGWDADGLFHIFHQRFYVRESSDDDAATPYRFSTAENCQKAIDTLGEEKLKLIFRIKE